uniref:RxLR effector protein n=1 Tax=Globisporangium ultimum (strain ATCC 200006 / CBS 805.95 / DAOM BR144) TaxID=431595 RepID=K3X412_GLOUD
MKIATSITAATIVLAFTAVATAADINVIGARDSPTMMRKGMTTDMTAPAAATAARGVDVKIATKDVLNRPTALVNKNTLAMDNNVFVSRSNIVFSQSDRLALARKVEALVTEADANNMGTAVLSRNVLKAVSGRDTDAAMMTKASAIVTAKDDAALRDHRSSEAEAADGDIEAGNQSHEQQDDAEQDSQSQTPRGVILVIGAKDILRQPTAVVNKNMALSDNQITISRSQLAPSQNDAVTLSDRAKVADVIAPASAISTTMKTKATGGDDDKGHRVGFLYVKDAAKRDAMTTTEGNAEWWGSGLGFGWRYPLGYWNTFGYGLYGGGCGLGMPFGGFYYC